MAKLTKTFIDGVAPGDKERFIWDDELPRFGLRVYPSGRMSYVLQYKTPAGATRRFDIGPAGALTPEEARKIARAKQAEIAQGADVSAERKAERLKPREMTVAELTQLYLGATGGKAEATRSMDRSCAANHILPRLGAFTATNLRRSDVQRAVDAIAVQSGPAIAIRSAAVLSAAYGWAERRGHVAGPNPCHGVEKPTLEPRDRVLSREELRRLGKSIEASAERYPAACAALLIIATTGARREEIVGLRWAECDLDAGCLRLANTKTGRSQRPLGKVAVELLRALPRMSDEFVFPNRCDTASADLKEIIARIFDAAGLTDARSHDLRRTFATVAAELGYSGGTIAELLGHSRQGVTERAYIRRPDAVLTAAATAVAAVISRAMRGEEAEIVDLAERRG